MFCLLAEIHILLLLLIANDDELKEISDEWTGDCRCDRTLTYTAISSSCQPSIASSHLQPKTAVRLGFVLWINTSWKCCGKSNHRRCGVCEAVLELLSSSVSVISDCLLYFQCKFQSCVWISDELSLWTSTIMQAIIEAKVMNSAISVWCVS